MHPLFDNEVQAFIAEHEVGEPWHCRRFFLSYKQVAPLLKPSSRVLCLGGEGTFERLLRFAIGCEVMSTGAEDLRYIRVDPCGREPFDLVLCMEVIEHVRDREDDAANVATFTGSGINTMLQFARDCLRPGGHLFLTTPNVCGWRNLWRWMNQLHPYMYPPHHRELSIRDVREMMRKACGNTMMERLATAVDCWSNHGVTVAELSQLYGLVERLGFAVNAEVRADDLFFLWQRA